ncbi:hypothetical protein Tco_0456235 [Tanacetum coccineum]
MNQTQMANNFIKNDNMAPLFGKYNYEEDVKEDTRNSSELLADLNVKFHDRAPFANQKRFYKRSRRIGSAKQPMNKSNETCFNYGKLAYSFDWDDKSVSFEDEGVTKVKAFMAIAEDESSVGKPDARSDYTHVNLHYVEDQRKNLLIKFNSLNQELSLYKSKLANLNNTKALNCSLQNEIARLNLENESQRDEIFDLKKVIKKWTSSKVTIDPLLIEQVPGNIVHALGGGGKKKEAISPKKVVFTKADESPSEIAPKITLYSKSECDNQEPLPPILKLSRVEPSGTSNVVVSLTELSLTTAISEETKKGSSSRKAPMIPKPFIDCKYYGFNDHHSSKCEYYPGCDIYGFIAHETTNCTKKTSSNKRKPRIANSGCSRHMTGVKQYLHKCSKESGPKVVFRDNSLGDTEGYCLVNYNGITFTRVAYVNGLKHNLISISQLRDANFKVLFTKTKMENLNDEKYQETKLLKAKEKMTIFPMFMYLIPFQQKNITILDTITPSDQVITSPNESPVFSIADDHPVQNEPDDFELANVFEPAETLIDIFEPQAITITGVTTRSRVRDSKAASAYECLYVNFLSKIEPKRLIDALKEKGRIIAMQKELNQFERNKVLTLVPVPHGKTIIKTKWIFRNKMDENGVLIKNKARLKAIMIFLAYAAYMGFMSAKKKSSVAMSSAEAEYVATAGCVDTTTNTITFTLSNFEKPLSYNRDEFTSVIGINYSENYVSIPTKETLRAGLATMGLVDENNPDISSTSLGSHDQLNLNQQVIAYCLIWGLEVDIRNIIFSNLVAKLQNGKKGRDPYVCHTKFLSLMIKYLLEDNSNDDGLTSFKPHTISAASFKTPSASEVSLTPHMLKVAKLLPEPEESLILPSGDRDRLATADTTKSIDVFELVEELGNQPNPTDAEKLGNVSFDELYGHNLDMGADESPFNVESEIKFVRKVDPNLNTDDHGTSSILDDQEMTKADSNLESMLDDEIESISGFEAEDDEDDHYKNKVGLSQADEAAVNNVIDELVDMANSKDAKINASADKPAESDPLVPRMVADALEERLHVLLSNTLKNILPNLLKDSIKKALPKFGKRVKKTLKAEVDDLNIKPIHKEFNALNILESRRNVKKQIGTANELLRWNAKNQLMLIKYLEDMVHSSVRIPRDIMVVNVKQLQTKVEKNAADILELPKSDQVKENEPSAEAQGEQVVNDSTNMEKPAPAQGEHESSDQNIQTSKALVVQSSEEPLIKKLKVVLDEIPIPFPTPLNSFRSPVTVSSIPYDQFTTNLFSSGSSEFSPIPPLKVGKRKGKAQFSASSEGRMTLEDAKAQMEEMNRLDDLQAGKEKSKKKIKKVLTPEELKAQAEELAVYEAKRAKMLEEYNHCISFRRDPF